MMRIARLWRRIAIGAGLLAATWLTFVQFDAWRARSELERARQDITSGRLPQAHRRLTALTTRPGALDGAAHYWLGICEALGGHPEAALRAFGLVPQAFSYEPLGAFLEAKANLAQGRLRPAEDRLAQSLAQSAAGPGRDQVRDLLSHVYQIEVRFDDVKALHHARLDEVDDPTRDLKELSNLDMQRIPHQALTETLEKAGKLAPNDDRVWLGKARIAIQSGRWDDAARWLERCRDANADAPVWKAWLEWARGTNRPAEASTAARALNPDQWNLDERLDLLAWLHRQRGDTSGEAATLEQWLTLDPTSARALERLAELAHASGNADGVVDLRRRKADVEHAMEAYRARLWSDRPLATAADRAALAGLAEAAGRPVEARALFAWASRGDANLPEARDGLARLDTQRERVRTATLEPLPDFASVAPSSPRDAVTSSPGAVTFDDDAESVGLTFVYENAETPIHQLPEPFGGGLALFDFDGDGWLDVFCVQGGPFEPDAEKARTSSGSTDRLFRNKGDGTFEDATRSSGIADFPTGHGHGVAVGDIDGDGHPDLFVTRWRSYALYRNRGDGTFEDVTTAWGLGGRRDWPTSAVFADLDGDGDADLYVCHYAVWDLDNPRLCRDPKTNVYVNCNPLDAASLPDHLFRNDGGTFTDVTADAGIVDRNGRGLGVVAADFDGDRLVDLFVANDSSANFLFRNQGGMRFEDVAHASGVAGNATGLYQAGMGTAAGDLDADGLLDIVVTNFYGESTTYFRNLGDGLFTDATAAVGLGVASRRLLGFGVALFDANNDGHLDLASANGHVNDLRPNYPYQMPTQLLLGSAGGRLTDVTDLAGDPWKIPRMGRGLAVGDLDNDGRPDVVVLSHNQPLAYMHNRSSVGHFLTLRLAPAPPSHDCTGTRIVAEVDGRRHFAWSVAGGSYQSASDTRIHLGLADHARVETLEITWPWGHVDRFHDLPADRAYLVREGVPTLEPLKGYLVDRSRN